MSWFKIDDKFHDHRKVRAALRSLGKRRDSAPIGLWSLAGTWSADNETDGFVPTDELVSWDDDGEALAERLVAAGLWVHDSLHGEDGYRFHQWPEFQPTKADNDAKREAARDRMRRVRANNDSTSREPARNEQRSSQNVRSTPVPVPVPVPSVSQGRDHVAPVDNPGGLTDQDLDAIAKKTGGGRTHAAAVAANVLERAGSRVLSPARYVLKAVDEAPDRHRYRGPRTKDTECPTHAGYPRDHCGACRSEQLTGGA